MADDSSNSIFSSDDPTAQLILATTLLGTGLKAAGQIGQSSFQAQQQLSNAAFGAAATRASAMNPAAVKQAALYNATVATQQANQTIQAAAENERRFRYNAQYQLADERGEAAAHGAAIDSGTSAALALSGNAANVELNALTIRHDGVVQAQAYMNTATMDQFQAQVAQNQVDFINSQADQQAAQGPVGAAAATSVGRNAALGTILSAAPTLLNQVKGPLNQLLGGGGVSSQDANDIAAAKADYSGATDNSQFDDVNSAGADSLA